MESTNSEFEDLDTPDSFLSTSDKLINIISRAIINTKNSESDHPPRAKKNYKNPCSLYPTSFPALLKQPWHRV